ncbi:MAG TPA: hypothetical protein VGC16_02485 [Rhizomicrobium sp.]
MKKDTGPEETLERQIALCDAALAQCLAGAEKARAEDLNLRRVAELDSAVALMAVSARLGAALARLRGDSRHTIRVERGDTPSRNGRSNGQRNGQT